MDYKTYIIQPAPNQYKLDRFIIAQEESYAEAEKELRNGKKESHWMWYIFPQIFGLGKSYMSMYYGIVNREEAEMYLAHPVLGKRLKNLAQILLDLPTNDPVEIFGYVDATKLNSCMTLFAEVDEPGSIFEEVIDKFFDGKDNLTVAILSGTAIQVINNA